MGRVPFKPDTNVRNKERQLDSLSGFNVFVQVAETRSFVAAGRALGVSASAVGKRVARLEERLGVRLFHRSTRSITLTAEGAQFLARSRRVLAEIEAAEAELSHSAGAPRGRLRVSLPLVSSLVLPALADFMATYPDIALDLDFSDRLVDVIEEGFDAVLRTGEPHDSRLSARRLGAFTQWLVASPDYLARHGEPQTPAELARHACLHYRYPATGKIEVWPLSPGEDGALPRMPVSMVCNNIETRLCFALRGRGIALLPDFSAREALDRGLLRRVLSSHVESQSIALRVMWPSGRQLPPKVRVFIDFLGERLFSPVRTV